MSKKERRERKEREREREKRKHSPKEAKSRCSSGSDRQGTGVLAQEWCTYLDCGRL
jgi:hypothetical protein